MRLNGDGKYGVVWGLSSHIFRLFSALDYGIIDDKLVSDFYK